MSGITRRDTFALGIGLAMTACGGSDGGAAPVIAAPAPTPTPTPTPTSSPTPTPTPAVASIAAVAATKRMRFGSTFAYSAPGADAGSFANPAYAALLERDCSLLVPENELKWQSIRPSATTFDFTQADAMLAYVKAHGMALRGHNLLWYVERWFPDWLKTYDFGTDPRAEAARLVREHVQTVTRRYAADIHSWDVVNEAIDPDTGALRTSVLASAVGGDTSLLDLAFVTARAELPDAELVYNDYMDAGTPKHRAGVLTLLKGFRDRGVPVDTLGVQSHLGFYSAGAAADIAAYNRDNMKPFLDEVVAMGYKLKVTELDVNDTQRAGTVASRDADTAVLVRGWLDLMMSYPQLGDVLVWGMSDRYSWLQTAEFGTRADGLPKRPDPYDADFQPKPMRQAIADAFTATAVRG